MDKQTLEREQPWRVAGASFQPPAMGGSGLQQAQKQADYQTQMSAVNHAQTVRRTLADVPNYQRELHGRAVVLGERLANIVSMLDGNPSTPGNVPSLDYPEDCEPFNAIITRIENTMRYVDASLGLVGMIEDRLGMKS